MHPYFLPHEQKPPDGEVVLVWLGEGFVGWCMGTRYEDRDGAKKGEKWTIVGQSSMVFHKDDHQILYWHPMPSDP